MREFIPLIKQNATYHPKYFTPSIRHHCIRLLKKKYHKSPTNSNMKRLNNAEKLLANLISSAKSEYKKNLISNFALKNQSKIYKYIRNIKKSTSIPNTVHFVRLVPLTMSTKLRYLTNFSFQYFPLVISCQQTMMSL